MRNGIPSLTELRAHIRKHVWNGRAVVSSDSNRDMFDGMCEYASTSLSELLTGDFGLTGWRLRIRGWYKGEITAIDPASSMSNFKRGDNTRHAHSWVRLPDGRILDPTWWQFTDAPVRMYLFDADDPRFEEDPSA